jgi:NAD-dependent dihydropyrimidine dehydrogenase PreA subunit
MIKEKTYATPNPPAPHRPVIFDTDICDGCNRCVEVCPMDVLIPNPSSGKPPLVLFPDECWYYGICVMECPRPGAIKFNPPLAQRIRWKRKETGEHFRV